jgi:hypothetical protein
MGNIDSINTNWIIVANNTSHDLGITIIYFYTIINNKKTPITCNAMPRIPHVSIGHKI